MSYRTPKQAQTRANTGKPFPFRVFQAGFSYGLTVNAPNRGVAAKKARKIAGHDGVAFIR